jgi:hypothetical protein
VATLHVERALFLNAASPMCSAATKLCRYSITSLARASNEVGILRPSALALEVDHRFVLGRCLHSGSFVVRFINAPIRRIAPGCCARAASGNTVAPPKAAMNSRRFICWNDIQTPQGGGLAHSGHLNMSNPIRGGLRCARCLSWVKSGNSHREHMLSVLPRKADVRADML